MKNLKLIVILVSVVPLAAVHGQGAIQPVLITFDGPPPQAAGTARTVQLYEESGISFKPMTANGSFGRAGGGGLSPQNGTPYIQTALTQSLMFTSAEGSSFGLLAVDLAEYSTVVPNAVTVPFVGYRQNGTTVTVNFTTDGVIDGDGPLADFETFHFDKEWTGLTRVEIPSFGWSLDNLVVAIPEPSAGGLLVASAAVGWLWRLNRRRAKQEG